MDNYKLDGYLMEGTLIETPVGSTIMSRNAILKQTIRRDIIAKSTLSKYFLVMITSNGVSITRKMAQKVARSNVSSVFISLDFATPEKHDMQRGLKGTYDKVLQSLQILKEEFYYDISV